MTNRNFSEKTLNHIKNEKYSEDFKLENFVQHEYKKIELDAALRIEIEMEKKICLKECLLC